MATLEILGENSMALDAIVRELEIIGEAAHNISLDFCQHYPQIPWNEMISMRNRLIHEYFGVDKKVVWDTCKEDLPKLKKIILDVVRRR